MILKDTKQVLAVGLSFFLIAAVSYGYRNPESVPQTDAGGCHAQRHSIRAPATANICY
jgi:hypothetical protein